MVSTELSVCVSPEFPLSPGGHGGQSVVTSGHGGQIVVTSGQGGQSVVTGASVIGSQGGHSVTEFSIQSSSGLLGGLKAGVHS